MLRRPESLKPTLIIFSRKINKECAMPSKSKKQRALMCIALGMKEGKTPRSYSKEAARISGDMSERQLKEFCKAPISNDKEG
jgi:hypothetical protein